VAFVTNSAEFGRSEKVVSKLIDLHVGDIDLYICSGEPNGRIDLINIESIQRGRW